jgi:hypothetical protein
MIINYLKILFGWGNQQSAADTGKISLPDDFFVRGWISGRAQVPGGSFYNK